MQVGSPPPRSPSVLEPAPCWAAPHALGTHGNSPLLTFVGTRHPLQRGHVVVVLPDGEGEDTHLQHREAVSSPEDMGAAPGTPRGSLGSPGSAQPRPRTPGCAPTGVGAQGATSPIPPRAPRSVLAAARQPPHYGGSGSEQERAGWEIAPGK